MLTGHAWWPRSGTRLRRWLGLTATPYRRDKLDDLIGMQVGPVRHTIATPRSAGSPHMLPGSAPGGRPTPAEVHDYHDEHTGVLASSLAKRAPGYTSLGFLDPRKLSYTPGASTAFPAQPEGAAA